MDYSKIDLGKGGKVRIKGKIRKIYSPREHNVKPLLDRYTVTLVSGKPQRTYYLKFLTKNDLDQWSFVEGESAVVEGILKSIDDKQVLIKVNRVSDDSVESL